MLGAGTIINPIIKVVTTVAILAAIGIFIVKPVLETTENVSEGVNENIRNSLKASQKASQGFDLDFSESRAESFANSLESTWPVAAREVSGCIREARGDGRAMARCEDFAETLVHSVQSDRSFALSYADSLEAQGDGAGAARVENCVEDAGYKPAPMQRCRDIADELLFG